MTIVFQGHVKSLDVSTAGIGKLAVTLATPMVEAGGQEWVIYVPQESAAHWLPGRAVSFTLYALDAQPSPRPSAIDGTLPTQLGAL